MKNLDKKNQLRQLTTELVMTGSIVNTADERKIADKIHSMLSDFAVFKDHPEYIRICSLNDDSLQRYSICALIKRPGVTKTVLGIGHFDTVAIEDYGILKPFATVPNELAGQLRKIIDDEDVLSDIEDPDYLFGRGSLDMKSGIAIWLSLLNDLNPQELTSNLLVCFVCDEEGYSKGMIDSLSHIRQMSEDFDLDIQAAIDTDYTSPQYLGDQRRFLYGGTIGKILVQYLCIGKESHAGDPYAGIDANELVSALIEEINMNPAYCDKNELDVTVPPITLSVKDDKQAYSVQTAKSASVSFNVTTINRSIIEWEEILLDAAKKAQSKVIDKLNVSYAAYCKMKDREFTPLPWLVKVQAFSGDPQFSLKKFDNEDEREFSLRWVSQQYLHDPTPQIILFLSLPYYPHHTMDHNDHAHQTFVNDMIKCAPGYTYLPYYPYISDLSFVSRGNPADIASVERLIPGYKQLNRIDWSVLNGLKIPMMNIGPWGKDAHKFTERVYVPSILSVYEILFEYFVDR
jgi:arginine utilization protein RocB